MEERMKELFADRAFIEKAMSLETPEEVKDLFAENEVEISVDEIRQVNEFLAKKTSGELTDTDLEQVNGGVVGILIGAIVGGMAWITGLSLWSTRRW